MTGSLVDAQTGQTYGDLVPPRSDESSVIEKKVSDFLVDAEYPVLQERHGILVHHPEPRHDFLTLTPDILLPDWHLAVEVDPCTPMDKNSRGFSHHGSEEADRLRNELLEAVGWTVIRLRLNASEGAHIGERDVVVASSGFTKAAQAALVEALNDFKADAPPRVRFVQKGSSPRPAQRRSHIVNIGEYNYTDGGHVFGWYPDLDSKEKVTLRLCMDGRFLYTHDRVPRFITEIGLHEQPREVWKDLLTEFLREQSPDDLGTTKWPWGDTFLVGDAADAQPIIEACDHDKHTLDRLDFWFTVSGIPAPRWTTSALLDDSDEPVVTLHPDAIDLGYRIVSVSSHHGYRGPYQRIVISRDLLTEQDAPT